MQHDGQAIEVNCTTWITPITPYALKLMTTARDRSKDHVVHRVDVSIFQVNSSRYQDVVDVEKQTFSCREFQDTRLPCENSFATIDSVRGDCNSC